MASPHESRPDARIRLLTSFWPRAMLGPIGVLLLACSLLIGFALVHTAFIVPLIPFMDYLESNNWSEPLIFCIALIVSIWGVFRLFNRGATRRLRKKRPYRWDRLQRLLEQPGAAARFPHRVAEHTFYKSPHFPMRHSKVVRMARPGQLVLCNLVTPAWERTPQPNNIPFEPIELEDESERSVEYIYASLEAQGVEAEQFLVEQREDKHRRQSASSQYERIMSPVSFAVTTGLILRMFGITGLFVWCVVVGMAIFIAISYLFYERKWWIVPGGLICRESSLWRKGMKIYHFTAKDTPLLLDSRRPYGYVMYGQKVFKVPFAALNWWAVAAAWMSTATPPTMEQIESFVGNKAEEGCNENRPLIGDA